MSSSSGRVASRGPIASSTALHGGSTGPFERPRRISGGSGAPAARSSTWSRKRLAPMPALAATSTVVEVPAAVVLKAASTRASSASRPMNRRLTTLPGIAEL